MSNWININDELPEFEFGYCLAVRHYHNNPELKSVQYAFFTKNREIAKSNNECYSRKIQGKNSIHFDIAEAGFIVTHWMELPKPPIA